MKTINTSCIPAAALAKMTEKASNRSEPIDNTELIAQFRSEGGQILHIRPRKLGYENGYTRGMTVAFKQKGSRIEISTAVQHRNDSFTKKIGTRTAITHFHAGKTVILPFARDFGVRDLKGAMGFMC